MKTSDTESWMDRADRIVANAPNQDWKKFKYAELHGEYEIPVVGYNASYKEVTWGTAKAVAFRWLGSDPRNKSFVGFLVVTWNGIMESLPLVNLDGVMTQETINRSFHGASCDLLRRHCPKCGKMDSLTHSRTTVRCTAQAAGKKCGYKESTL